MQVMALEMEFDSRHFCVVAIVLCNMLQAYVERIILDFCSFYGKSAKIISFENEKVPEIQVEGNEETIKGIRNIVSNVCNDKTKSPEELSIQDQWIEYALTNAIFLHSPFNAPFILKELNEYISDKVYFTGNKQSSADLLLYLIIYDVMVNLTFQDKEKYMNISRWFNNMQQDQKLRSWRLPICFSKTRLYS